MTKPPKREIFHDTTTPKGSFAMGMTIPHNRKNMGQEPSSSSSDLFESAVSALYGPLHNQGTKSRAAQERANAQRHWTVVEMRTYLHRLRQAQVPVLFATQEEETGAASCRHGPQIIHIAGTKGKGSTAVMCEALCRLVYGKQTGLFTSPHLCDIRERIRIQGRPTSKAVFGKAYWTVRTALEEQAAANKNVSKDDDDKTKATSENASLTNDTNPTNRMDELPILPGYFRMLTLMACHIFATYQRPPLDVIVLEVGMGGRYDATNLFDNHPPCFGNPRDAPPPTVDDKKDDDQQDVGSCHWRMVCGVTLIDYDHVRVLGHTLPEISWEKAGIFSSRQTRLGPHDTQTRFLRSSIPTSAATHQ